MTDLISRGDALAVVQYSTDKVEGIKNLPAADAVPVEQFKAQMIELVQKFEVLIGCTGVSVLTRAIEQLEPAYPVEEE